MSKDFWKTKKIRTVSLDTDVLSDVLYREIILGKSLQTKEDKNYLKRADLSFEILKLFFSVKVTTVGSVVVREELKGGGEFLKNLFDNTFDEIAHMNKVAKRLAEKYESKCKIKPADALIIASLSVKKTDCFISWNRKHIANPKNFQIIKFINKYAALPTPMLFTPLEFIQRVVRDGASNTIWISHEPNPRKFYPSLYPST